MRQKLVNDYTTFDDDDWTALPPAAKQAACNVVCTAAEGGVNYWASVLAYVWMPRDAEGNEISDMDGGLLCREDTHAVLRDAEDEDGDKLRLDGPAVVRGLAKLADGSVSAMHPSAERSWRDALEKLLAGGDDLDLDASDADLAVLADAFDAAVAKLGQSRRAWRGR